MLTINSSYWCIISTKKNNSLKIIPGFDLNQLDLNSDLNQMIF